MSLMYAHAQKNETDKGIKIGNIVEMSGEWYIAYRNGIEQIHADEDTPEERVEENRFLLKRSYFTLKKKLNDVFSVRYTMDLTVDTEGDDAGNVETRLKYLYLKVSPKSKSKLFTGNFMEIGMVHTPWLDYEQKINTYRVQDNMFIERNKIFNSADFGILIGGNIGPKMDADFLKKTNKAMPGKYMSYALGIYNGAGYSGIEKNKNKVLEGRLSFRPFAEKLPQLQLSTSFVYGKANSALNPDFKQLIGFLTFSGEKMTLIAQAHKGIGDFKAKYVKQDNPAVSLKNQGFSFFGEYQPTKIPLSFWCRYDMFDVDNKRFIDIQRYIGGITYKINKYLRVIADYEYNISEADDNNIYEINFEIRF